MSGCNHFHKQERIVSHDEWIDQYLELASNSKLRQETFSTPSGRDVSHLYSHRDIEDVDPELHLGVPGTFPFTRGVYPNMYRSRLWTMRQYAGFSTATESNKRYKFLLSRGQTGLSVAFDLPTQIGYDSDDTLSHGEVGKVGVAIDTLADMERLLDGIPLGEVSTSMTINSTASILLSMYLVVAEKQGVSWNQVRGTIQNDLLKEYIARGTYAFPPEPSMRLITDIFAFCSKEVPKWNTISISGYHIREAGSTASQELAFTFANAKEYVRRAMQAGMDVDVFAPQLSFFFNAHNNLIEEVAKFRAARRLWAEIMRDEFSARDPKSMQLRFHTQTAGSTLTAQQPENNVVRVAIQALAAVCGGTQSLHTNSFDEALALPTERSVRIALRTQQMIAYESGVADIVDPFAGSYVVERWTREIYDRVREYLKKIDDLGGALAAIHQGFQQKEIQEAAYRWQRDMETGKYKVVGVNAFAEAEEKADVPITLIDPSIEREQVEHLAQVKAGRNADEVERYLKTLKETAEGEGNLMPAILDSVRAYASIGEIQGTLRSVFGEYREISTL